MGLCETSNFSIFTFINASDLKFGTRSYSSCVYLMMRFKRFEWKSLRNDNITLCHSIQTVRWDMITLVPRGFLTHKRA